jgi:hypothetical protein
VQVLLHFVVNHKLKIKVGSIHSVTAVPWLRLLVAGLSPRSPGFAPRLIHMVDRVALGQVFLRVLRFYSVNIIPLSFSILIYHLGDEQYIRYWQQFRDVVHPIRKKSLYWWRLYDLVNTKYLNTYFVTPLLWGWEDNVALICSLPHIPASEEIPQS